MAKAKTRLSERLITKAELAEETGLKVSFIEKAMREYGMPSFKLGAMVRFKLSEVENWVEKRRKNHAS